MIRSSSKGRGLLGIALVVMTLLTACGSQTKEEGGTAAYSGMDYLRAGDYQTAQEAYQKEIDNGRKTEQNYRGLGIAQMGLADYKNASKSFEHALEEAGVVPGSLEYDINYYLGSCYYKLEDYDQALGVYDAIVTLRPRDPDALVMRGTVKRQMGDLAGMEGDYKAAIDLDPDDYDRIIEIYQKMEEAGMQEDGIAYLTEVLEKEQKTIGNYDRGRLSYYIGDYQTAKECLEKEGGNRDYSATILLGKTYEALGDFNYASSVYQTFLNKDQTHAEVYNQLGLCAIQMKDYAAALTAFQSGLAISGSGIEQSLEFNQVVAYEYLGDFQRASMLLQEYLGKYPGDETAKREFTFLKTR